MGVGWQAINEFYIQDEKLFSKVKATQEFFIRVRGLEAEDSKKAAPKKPKMPRMRRR